MITSSLKERFARLEPGRVIDRVQSGSPGILALRSSKNLEDVETIPAIFALYRRGMTMLRAKRAVEVMVEKGSAVILVPKIEDLQVLAAELKNHGVSTAIVGPDVTDVRGIREHLGYSQEEFAHRFGLDLDSLQNWESGRRKMPKAARSYMRVIQTMPQQASEALEDMVLQP